MPLTVEWPGLAKLTAQMVKISNYDPMPVLQKWEDIIVEGNRRGVLSGLDGLDQPMPPLQYRNGKGKRTANRKGGANGEFGKARFNATGRGPFATGLHDNLTTAEYQKLTGPRLAPRRDQSRVIKNLKTEIRMPSPGRWEVIGSWDDVVSVKGVKFLGAHFEGRHPHIPWYDLRPIRPRDWQFCVNALRADTRQLFFNRI
jgi:hypothetical protein